MEKVLVAWREDQTSHNILLSQSLIQCKVLTLFNSMKIEGGERAAEENSEANRSWAWGVKGRNSPYNRKMQAEEEGLMYKPQQVIQIYLR